MSQPPNSTSFAPSARWTASSGEVRSAMARTYRRRRATNTCSGTLERMSVAWQASLFGTDPPAIDASFGAITRVQLDATAWVDHLPGWLSGPDEVMDRLVRTAPWRSSTRPMYDRIVAVPRLTAWYAHTDDAPPILDEMRAALSA